MKKKLLLVEVLILVVGLKANEAILQKVLDSTETSRPLCSLVTKDILNTAKDKDKAKICGACAAGFWSNDEISGAINSPTSLSKTCDTLCEQGNEQVCENFCVVVGKKCDKLSSMCKNKNWRACSVLCQLDSLEGSEQIYTDACRELMYGIQGKDDDAYKQAYLECINHGELCNTVCGFDKDKNSYNSPSCIFAREGSVGCAFTSLEKSMKFCDTGNAYCCEGSYLYEAHDTDDYKSAYKSLLDQCNKRNLVACRILCATFDPNNPACCALGYC
ncbi:hypothetical protein A3F66_03580 [candidate division TM6 bacterium RIFCSPHIGHO2_12_FULL_32_22]|nr:MAG: hypothetical protein A3F66_03580 [candidate division TM6 bacterium RIFCSPHIGHO2_12_FULL_32_22]